jgi:phospholipid-transporting ATPase
VFALVVDGQVLSMVFAGAEQSKEKFLIIGKRCKTVICSRVTPLQKALVVRLVRRSLKKSITLAIGDGANDVSMIQEAHVGVGIMGKEGAQAVRAADYAFGEFRFLQRLLNIHGRFSYLRMANLILYSFYKNFVFITIQFYFGFVNAWSGQVLVTFWLKIHFYLFRLFTKNCFLYVLMLFLLLCRLLPTLYMQKIYLKYCWNKTHSFIVK